MGKRPQPRLRIDALTGEWRNGEAGEGRGSEPCERGGLRHQAGGASWRPPTGGEDITWPDQVAPWGRKASSTRKIKPQTSNLQRVLPKEVTHVRPKSHTPLLRADDTWGRVPPHIFINLRILGPRGRESGHRPCPAGTPNWVGFQ